MKILFAGGGTAGHITPAIAIAEELLKSTDNAVAFVGRRSGEENRLIKNQGYKLYEITAKGLKRKLSVNNIANIFCAVRSVFTSLRILKDFKPDAVIGTGGYVCWPVLKAANIIKIPTFIHESNLYPGVATKNLASSCKGVLVNYDATKDYLKRKDNVKVVGNPVREEFEKTSRSEARKKLGINDDTVLTVSFGGSGGSNKLNETIVALMKLEAKTKNFYHIHATGAKYYDDLKNENQDFFIGKRKLKIVPYIDEMPKILTAADIIISRCGAMTLSEISAVGIPSILIPSPNVTDDHQKKNAEFMVNSSAAVMIEESALEVKNLYKVWLSLYESKRKREAMGKAASELYVSESAKKIISIVKEYS